MAADPIYDADTSCTLLDPDHRLLEKFQKALKDHLVTQISRLKEEVIQIDTETQKKNADIEKVGVVAYDYQQKVHSLQKELETTVQNVETIAAAKEEEEHDLEKNKKELKNIENRLFQKEKDNRDLLREVEAITRLNKQLCASEIKIECTISVNKRKADKTRLENDMLVKDKRRQDFMIHALSEEVWKQESELETLNIQMAMKEKDMEELDDKIAAGNTNIAALQAEYRGLMHAWNSVIVAIGTRDKGLECLQQELKLLQENQKSLMTEIEQIKKLAKRELAQNETFTYAKTRILGEIKTSQTDLESQMEKKSDLDVQICKLQSIAVQTEQNIKEVQDQLAEKTYAFDRVIKECESASAKKLRFEEEILSHIQSELASTKLGKKMKSELEVIKQKRKEVHIILVEATNRKSFLMAESAFHRAKNEELKQYNKDLLEQFEALEKEQKILHAIREKYEFQYRKKHNLVEVLNHKLEKSSEKEVGEVMSKEELRFKELEKSTEEVQQSVRHLQVVWLREQNNILAISAQRQEQIQNMNLLKKQVLILEQKNVRISDEIENIKKCEEKVKHHINKLQNRTVILCNTLFKKRNKKVDMDRNNILLQSCYETKLKDSELELLQIEAEIADIEEDKVTLSKEIIDINREAMEWEKKFMIAKDTLMNMKEARGKGGELNSMRLEIHKMEVIYAQLKRAQDKLLKDMEYCLCRRDKIILVSEAIQTKRYTKTNNPSEAVRMNFTKRLGNLKNQIKQVQNDIISTKKTIKMAEDKTADVSKSIDSRMSIKRSLTKKISDLKNELEDTKINREFKFELLVMNQRKALMYKQIIRKATPYVVYKKHEDLVAEYNKAKSINGKLVKITDNMNQEFPDQNKLFIRIGNTLGLVSLSMYV